MNRIDKLWNRTDVTFSEIEVEYRKQRYEIMSSVYRKFKLDARKIVYETSNKLIEELSKNNGECEFNHEAFYETNRSLQMIKKLRGVDEYEKLTHNLTNLINNRAGSVPAIKIDIGVDPILNYIDIKHYGENDCKVEEYFRINNELVGKILGNTYLCVDSIYHDDEYSDRLERTQTAIKYEENMITLGHRVMLSDKHGIKETFQTNLFAVQNGILYVKTTEDEPFTKISELSVEKRIALAVPIEKAQIALRALYDYMLQITKSRETEKRQASNVHTIRVADADVDDNIIYKPIEDIVPNKIISYDKPIGTHSSPVPHDVRGHLRHYKNGKVVFIKGYHKSSPNYKGRKDIGKTMIEAVI